MITHKSVNEPSQVLKVQVCIYNYYKWKEGLRQSFLYKKDKSINDTKL